MKETNRGRAAARFVIFAALFALAALGVLCRYGYLMLASPAPRPGLRNAPLAGRGPILDRNGRILAMETRLGNISVWRPDIDNRADLAEELAPILEVPAGDILERLDNSASDFIYLKKQADESTLKLIEAAQEEGRLPEIGIEAVVGRIYPEGKLAAQIIGFVGDENAGLGGIEYAFNGDLVPRAGTRGAASPRGTVQGSRIYLTIDTSVQHILETIGEGILRENEAEAVMFMAMDPRTGDVLGSASLPGFDPNNFRYSDASARMDRPAIWAYEPGSVFKVFSMAGLLDSGAVSETTTFFCNGHYERTTAGGETIRINCLGAHGNVSLREIIIFSCNAGAAYASDRLGSGEFYGMLRAFGFGARTGAGNPGETAGLLRSPERWSERSKPTISMGQEIAVSAMQMIQAASAVANDGILVPPRIISKIVSGDNKTVREYEAGEPRRVLRPDAARAMRRYMMDVTSDIGTGWRANVEDLSLAVKTGTAQLIDPNTGAYSASDFIASCIALLPAESPSLVLYLVIVKPKGSSILGGRIAAPPIREAAEALINYLGIPRGRNLQITHPGTVTIPSILPLIVDDRVPDFTGVSKRRLLPFLLRDDLNVHISGDGWVVRQYPPPGTAIGPETEILLELE
ncbi:MAG: transpeptidase family protein [Treponema sp.]|jgi:cell division protein FtsI (penicillin-binding protein 3)|nr:transpeptidase family protein [Treponema sp.]